MPIAENASASTANQVVAVGASLPALRAVRLPVATALRA
jgi:hypothetical protein